jgi:hypothetical protein
MSAERDMHDQLQQYLVTGVLSEPSRPILKEVKIMDDLTRRALLAATAAGGILTAATAAGAQTNEPVPQPRRPGHGGTNPGPSS